MQIFLTPEEISQLTWSYPSLSSIILFVLAIAFFLFLNAFFVANEFASARVRESQLLEGDESETKGQSKRRNKALHIVRHLDTYLSANQVGITIASLALGGMGEPFIESLIAPPLSYLCHLTPTVVSAVSYALAYSLFTFAHVVLGELVPKSLAIRKPLALALATAPGMTRFAKLSSPIVRLFNNTANGIAHYVFGVDPHYEPNAPHSAEEIAIIVEESGKSKAVTETEAEISKNALELNDRSVHDIYVPRSSIEVLDVNDGFAKNMERVINSPHSRFPLVQGHLDKVQGWLHVKDFLKMANTPNPDLMQMRRELKVVPETMKLDTLLDFFSKEHTHFALVVDEYGDSLGLVFLDDVLEEIVGDDIRDEFETEHNKDFFPNGEGRYTASGSLALFDLEEYLPELGEIETEGDVSTLGGFITEALGHMPACGESVTMRNYIFTVTGCDRRRVTQVSIRRSAEQPVGEA